MTTITLDALPEAVRLKAGSTAMVVVDMQNDFGSPGGMFDRAGIDISGIRAAVDPTRQSLEVARKLNLPVIYLKMAYQSDLSDLGPADALNRAIHRRLGVGETVERSPGQSHRVLVRDGWGTAIIDELTPEPGDVVIHKSRFSGFFQTQLHDLLKSRGVTHLLVTGCTTSVCVESTIRDAFFRDYTCVLLEDCTAEPIGGSLLRSNHEASVLLVQTMFGFVSTSDAWTAAALAERGQGPVAMQS